MGCMQEEIITEMKNLCWWGEDTTQYKEIKQAT